MQVLVFILYRKPSIELSSISSERFRENSSERAFGVVVSRFLRMEKAASSIPATSIFEFLFEGLANKR